MTRGAQRDNTAGVGCFLTIVVFVAEKVFFFGTAVADSAVPSVVVDK